MTTIEFCMMLVMFFLTWHLWRMSKRIGELGLNAEAQWKTIRANRKRIAALKKLSEFVLESVLYNVEFNNVLGTEECKREERDGNGKEDTHDPDRH